MLVRLSAVFFLCILSPALGTPVHDSTLDLLIERPAHSLRGETINLDDRWSSARLLAYFGEPRLAYDTLRKNSQDDSTDPQVERFEARLLSQLGLPGHSDSLLALQTYSGGLEDYYLHCLRRSRLNLMANRAERALAFLSLTDSLSFVAFDPYKDFVRMRALYELGRYGEACQIGEQALTRGIPHSLSPRFETSLLDAYLVAEDYSRAHEFIEVLKARRSKSKRLAPVLVRDVDVLFLLGDTLSAVDSALDLMKDPRTRHRDVDLAQRVIEVISPDALGEDDLLDLSRVLLRSHNLTDVDRLLETLSKKPLDEGQRERHAIYLADLYYKSKRYSKSFDLIDREFSDASLKRWAMLLRARVLRKTGQPERSADAYVVFAKTFPYDSKASEALLVAADLYLRVGDRSRYLETLQRVITTYPSRRHGRIATMKTAVYYLERKHYSRGAAILEKAVERTGRENEELLYYLSEAYGRMGKKDRQQHIRDEIQTVDPLSFYLNPSIDTVFTLPVMGSNGLIALDGEGGLLAFLKDVFEQREQARRRVREALPELKDIDGALQAGAFYLQRGRHFLQMGFADWADEEFAALEANGKLPARIWFELGVLYDDFAMNWRSVRAYQRVYYSFAPEERDVLDSEFNLLMHPLPHPAAILEKCSQYGVPPHLVYAMMRQESRFDANAVSRAGAMGLMQLMPATSEQAAAELGFPPGVHENLFVPEINLTFGIWYASQMLEQSGGDVIMMLSAYNAGFGNARRWFGRGGQRGRKLIASVDGIDYSETRDYVKRIVETARVYHAFYFAPGNDSPWSIH